MRVFYLPALVALVFVLPSWAGPASRGQESSLAPRKLDEFGDLKTDDVMARLDAFALELQRGPKLRGFIVGYGEPRRPPGGLLRKVYGYQDYLIEKRGVSPETIKVVEGGGGERLSVELWLVPEGAPAPTPRPAARSGSRSPFKFDEILFGEGCLPEFTVELYTLDDGLRFYAEALRASPKARGRITIFPSSRRDGAGQAGEEARRAKKLLVTVYGVEAARVVTRISRRRQDCARAELWVEPNGAAATPEAEDEF